MALAPVGNDEPGPGQSSPSAVLSWSDIRTLHCFTLYFITPLNSSVSLHFTTSYDDPCVSKYAGKGKYVGKLSVSKLS
jgi:hypothetical protein